MAHERNSSKPSSATGYPAKSVRENRRKHFTQILHGMLETEARRLAKTECPVMVGHLWYDPALSILWQVTHVYGSAHRAEHAVIELSGLCLASETLYSVRRRLSLRELADRYLYFGSVHDTHWRQH